MMADFNISVSTILPNGFKTMVLFCISPKMGLRLRVTHVKKYHPSSE
ncbi:MAG: hypothetical protein PHW19_12280 [Salinivirgaceae bacterium]|nr:hypothetical protein [Salinivirgaceae bacterium]